MPKNISVTASVNTVIQSVTVTAAAGSAGAAVAYSSASSSVFATNTSLTPGLTVEYQVNATGWVQLDKGEGNYLPINLATDVLYFRRMQAGSDAATVELAIDSVPAMSANAHVIPVIIVSSAAPVNADGRADGTVYIQTV